MIKRSRVLFLCYANKEATESRANEGGQPHHHNGNTLRLVIITHDATEAVAARCHYSTLELDRITLCLVTSWIRLEGTPCPC